MGNAFFFLLDDLFLPGVDDIYVIRLERIRWMKNWCRKGNIRSRLVRSAYELQRFKFVLDKDVDRMRRGKERERAISSHLASSNCLLNKKAFVHQFFPSIRICRIHFECNSYKF